MISSDLIPAAGSVPKSVRAKQLAEWFNVTQATIWNWVERGILPAPRDHGPRTRVFNVEAVRAAVLAFEAVELPDNNEATTGKAV